ncbi:MAG: hypothetical protein U1E18_29475, partial [Brevundimonas sp.]|uniref:hypothetical protein n=1 Tax=Brevundimonas sp. TaxID=1871086 RepID=UPI002ABB6A3A
MIEPPAPVAKLTPAAAVRLAPYWKLLALNGPEKLMSQMQLLLEVQSRPAPEPFVWAIMLIVPAPPWKIAP